MSSAAGSAAIVDVGRETLERMSKVDRYNSWLFSKVERYVGQRVLEVGSGTGNMSAFILDRPRVVLSDLSETYQAALRARNAARPNVTVVPWDLEQPPPPGIADEGLDTILCLNVLEHVKDDAAALRHMGAALAPGGRLLLMVPAVRALYGSLDIHLDHHRRYGRRELLDKLAAAGFEVETHFYMNFFGMLGWFLNSRVFRRQILSTRQLGLFNAFTPFFIAFERRLRLPVGLSLVAIGRRGAR